MNITLLPADTYIVVNKTILSDECRKILSILYQPIIGSIAINLYFTFWANLDRSEIIGNEHTHYNLANSMQLSISEIKDARKKLEAVGLLKTYFKKDSVNTYIYELYSPMSANSFLNHPILNIILYNTVEKKEYDKIVKYFKLPKYDISDYKDISATFTDIFKSSSYKNVQITNPGIKKETFNDLKINNNIDFDLIISSLPNSSINKHTFNDEIKNLISKLAFVYDLDNLQIVDIVRISIIEKGIIDKVRLLFQNHGLVVFQPGILIDSAPAAHGKRTAVGKEGAAVEEMECLPAFHRAEVKAMSSFIKEERVPSHCALVKEARLLQ